MSLSTTNEKRLLGGKMRNKFIHFVIMLAFSVSAHAQMDEIEEDGPKPMEEITVYGDPDDVGGAGGGYWDWPADDLGWMASFWDFSIADSTDSFGMHVPFIDLLNDSLAQLNEASEALCEPKVEDWRSDCHHQIYIAGVTCGLTGVYAVGTAVRYLLPVFLRTSTAAAAVTTTGVGCYGLTTRAQQTCDDIANSERARDVAQCD